MKQPIVIFGIGEIAELADFYFTHDFECSVAGFAVDQAYLTKTEFRGRPVVPFERVAEVFPPDAFGFFVAVSYAKLNAFRAEKVAAVARNPIGSYLTEQQSSVFPDFELKENCFILEDNTIQPFARVGAKVSFGAATTSGIIR